MPMVKPLRLTPNLKTLLPNYICGVLVESTRTQVSEVEEGEGSSTSRECRTRKSRVASRTARQRIFHLHRDHPP